MVLEADRAIASGWSANLSATWKVSGEEELDQTVRPIARSLQGRGGR